MGSSQKVRNSLINTYFMDYPSAIGGSYPHVTGLFPFIARTHAYLEESDYGSVIRSRPIPVEYDIANMLLLAQNVFGLHCVMQMCTVEGLVHSGYIFLFRYQIRCGPYVPTMSLTGVTPLYAMGVSHYVSSYNKCIKLPVTTACRRCYQPILWILGVVITIFYPLEIVHFVSYFQSR